MKRLEDIKFLPDYPVRSLNDVPKCKHENAQFQGLYSLIGYYYCPDCKSKFEPQEFQAQFF